MYEQWTYSYMSAVLNTGASCRRKRRVGDINTTTTTTMEGGSNTRTEAAVEGLSASDLYVVPRNSHSATTINTNWRRYCFIEGESKLMMILSTRIQQHSLSKSHELK